MFPLSSVLWYWGFPPKYSPKEVIFSFWILCFNCSQQSRQFNFRPSTLPFLFQIQSLILMLNSVTEYLVRTSLLSAYISNGSCRHSPPIPPIALSQPKNTSNYFLGIHRSLQTGKQVGFPQIFTSPSELPISIPMSHPYLCSRLSVAASPSLLSYLWSITRRSPPPLSQLILLT